MSNQPIVIRGNAIKFLTLTTAFFALFFCCLSQPIQAQTTAFTYQGKLTDGGAAANGSYDLTFRLFDSAAGGTQIGGGVSSDGVPVSAGIFTVNLNFGLSPFTSATGNFLEISVRPGAGGGAFTTLSPRQPLTSSPYAVQTIRAASAETADNASQLGGVAANQFVQTADPRMADARVPLAGSSDYVQNTTTQQTAVNINIGGSATVGGTLNGNVVNAAAQFNIAGSRVISIAGANNFFAGIGAGQVNTGSENSFVGRNAGQTNIGGLANSFFGASSGQANTTGSFNAFVGSGAGLANLNGGENAFFGYTAGRSNTSGAINAFFGKTAGFSNTTGNANSFFGYDAGRLNTIGTNNTFVGVIAGDANTIGVFNTVIGAQADVATNNLSHATAIGAEAIVSSSNSVVLGRAADTVRVPGNLNVTGTFTGSFTVPAGNITGVLAAVNGGTGPAGTSGSFLRSNGTNWTGAALQAADIIGGSPNYIQNTTTTQALSNFSLSGGGTVGGTLSAAQFNIGTQRMLSAPGAFNTFVGGNTGMSNTGGNNVFVGYSAGFANTAGSGNSFFGTNSGQLNTSGSNNSYFGELTGFGNIDGSDNAFFGQASGFRNAGSGNSFFGKGSGSANDVGNFNSFFGTSSGTANTTGSDNAFFGASTGAGTTEGSSNSFFGTNSGSANTTGSANDFFGKFSGSSNTTGSNNAFFGVGSGVNNLTGEGNVFIGGSAGFTNAVGSENTIIGYGANVALGDLTNATAIGAGATVSQSGSLILGNDSPFGSLFTRIGIGISAPAFKVHIVDPYNTGLRVETQGLFPGGTVASFGGKGAFYIDAAGVVGGRLTILENGNVGINDNNPANKLSVAGTIAVGTLGAAGSTTLCRNASLQISTCSSSIRYKQNIESFNPGLSLIRQLRPVTFNWRADNQADMGLVAEEVAKAEPLLAAYNGEGEVEGVKYDRVGVVLVNAVNEQQAQIERLQNEISGLKKIICTQNPTAEFCQSKK